MGRNLDLYRSIAEDEVVRDIPDHVDEVISMSQNIMKKVLLQRELMEQVKKTKR